MLPSAHFHLLFNYSSAALIPSGRSSPPGFAAVPHSSTHTWKNPAGRALSLTKREHLRAVGNLHLGCCVDQVSVQSKAGTIFSLLPFSFSYLTEVLSPQSLAIGYQLPAEPETKLSLKQRGEKREKSTKESWSQLLLGSPAGSVARTKARGCCCFCASCHWPAKPPGAQRGTACLQSIPTTAFSHALLSQELKQIHPNSWNGQKEPREEEGSQPAALVTTAKSLWPTDTTFL